MASESPDNDIEQDPLTLCWDMVRQYLAATAQRELDKPRAELDMRLVLLNTLAAAQ